ncbi:MAG: DMT family transporter [Cypionkella sp.]|uniref:DMT family transporter n=1 Tax=Cypionkella sp. TaxID=2811411 RepID=UPI002ABA805A|nr:DMT family transporter [Cypionkella sp.]MDZ4312484.1 DMT family transporter [Cypionkella sp.]MDZ4394869.1 DMT family transporter [Cypionkella sp.]
MSTRAPNSPAIRAAFWMIGSILAFSAMAIAAKQIGPRHDSFEIMTARSAVGFVLVLALATATGRLQEITARNLGGHALRNIIHFTGQNLWFWALTMIPLAQLFAIEFTSPLWVVLLAALMLGERLTKVRLIAATLGFVGVLIVARPDMADLNPGVLAAAGAALCFATTSVVTKKLTTGISILCILFWLTLMQFFFGLAVALADGRFRLPTAATLPWLCLIGLAGVTAHYCITTALKLAPASYVMPLDFLRLPLIAVVGALIYAEPLDPYVILGAAVIFVGIWINIRAEIRPKGHTEPVTPV